MSPEAKDFAFLALAIFSEVIATTTLKASESFTKPIPSLIVLIGYGLAFYFFSVCMNSISVGVAYAIWSGAGIILVALLSWIFYGQVLDRAGMIGVGFILIGVLVLNLFSRTVVR